jgi:REP element-mobilizing transposase RayT
MCLTGGHPPNHIPAMPERTNPRHSSFDYRSVAAYFVTVCACDRRCLFGTVKRGRVDLALCGQIVVEEWRRSEEIRDEVVLDAFVVMPNHLHGIVCIVPPGVDDVSPRGYDLDVGQDPTCLKKVSNDGVGPHGDAALREREVHPRWREGRPQRYANSLGSMIAGFKGTVTRRINEQRSTAGAPVWQSRYHDRILRNEEEWRARRRYIARNPDRWIRDRYHP